MPIMVCHGLYDMIVPEFLGKHAITTLEKLGYSPVYKTYPMQHSVCAEEIVDISDWLKQVFGL
jgi:phospholipase/carboxylesterase